MAWRLAKSLETLRSQINAAYPARGKSSDGTIGDTRHSVTKSDHNPNAAGVVTAMDITHDPAHGLDAGKLAETLRLARDKRIKYIISNARIVSSKASPWVWRAYSGSNAHRKHVHISVDGDPTLYDDTSGWVLGVSRPVTPPGRPAVTSSIATSQRQRMAKTIIDFEARRDASGRLAVYILPPNDGGGTYEVAGINDRYHPEQAAKLKQLLATRAYEEAESSAAEYLLAYTAVAATWTKDAGIEFYLRDCVFHRGPKGAVRILQRAVGLDDDGIVGPLTRTAMTRLTASDLLTKLRTARENYEREVVGYRPEFWPGLVSRWDKALVAAQKFQSEVVPSVGAGKGVAAGAAGAVVVTGGAIAQQAHENGVSIGKIAVIALVVVVFVVVAWFAVRHIRKK